MLQPLLIAIAFFACQAPLAPREGRAAESDVSVPEQTARWVVLGETIELQGGTLRTGDLVLADDVVGLPSFDASGQRLAVAVLSDAPYTAVIVRERTRQGWGAARVLVDGDGAPDRVALSPDGRTVAFVQATRGLPAVWVVPFTGGAASQLTNVALAQAPGGPPKGFVPPPARHPPRFNGDLLEWEAEAELHRVRVP